MSELGSIIQGGGIVLSGALVWRLVDVGLKVWGARHQKTHLEPDPLNVETKAKPEYVTKEDFEKHVAENTKEHEALCSRLNRNDRETSEMKGMLATIRDIVMAINDKLHKKAR